MATSPSSPRALMASPAMTTSSGRAPFTAATTASQSSPGCGAWTSVSKAMVKARPGPGNASSVWVISSWLERHR